MLERHTILKGFSKILYEHSEPGTALLHFQDVGMVEGWGVINAGLSALLMQRVEAIGLPTHFMRVQNSREHLVRLVDALPVFVSVHNIASATFGQRLGIAEGTPLARNIVEVHLRDAKLGHPLITQEHAASFGWCGVSEWEDIISAATRLNDFLMGQFSALHLELMSFRVEFGRCYSTQPEDEPLRICDEISLETSYLKDLRTGYMHRPLERATSPKAKAFYQDVARRFGILTPVPSRTIYRRKIKTPPALRLAASQQG